jgi:ubiquinone biosynthesis protein UbiJ
MLRAALLAGAERGLNGVLRLDPTALPRLAKLSGQIIEIDCTAPAWKVFILADAAGCGWQRNGAANRIAACALPPRICCAWPQAATKQRSCMVRMSKLTATAVC